MWFGSGVGDFDMKMAAALLLLVPLMGMTSQIGEASGNYAKDLGQINGMIGAIKATEIRCVERFLSLKETLSKAMLDWNISSRSTLDEVESRTDELMREVAFGMDSDFAELKAEWEISHRKKDEESKVWWISVPTEKAKAECLRFIDEIRMDLSDIENFSKSQLNSVRMRKRELGAPTQ
jgi:hypothetical protein